MDILSIALAKTVSSTARKLNFGNGSTWPGHLILKQDTHFLKRIFQKYQIPIIVIAGTNGKTTTSRLLRHILMSSGKTIVHNESGANLLNGIVSAVLLHMTVTGKLRADYAIFEVDENVLPKLLMEVTPQVLLILNLFRDQLDRYGEVDSVTKRWGESFKNLPESTLLVLNADDPQVAYLGEGVQAKKLYFGVQKKNATNHLSHAADSLYCPRCGQKLDYKCVSFSHLGIWECPKCHLKRPKPSITKTPSFPLHGTYNEYNTIAAVSIATELGFSDTEITRGLHSFSPAFGRQEEVSYQNKHLIIYLSKNPTGFNESLRTVKELHGKFVLLALNDRYADGTDVSWIWDVDFEEFTQHFKDITVTGDRAFEMALRMQYADVHKQITVEPDTKRAIEKASAKLPDNETLYILPTYTAMLDIRKIISGKKIL